jgi:hypothetical protein
MKFLIIPSLLLAALSFSACQNKAVIYPKEISAEEFIIKSKKLTKLDTISWAFYTGLREGNVYLELGNLPIFGDTPVVRVYYTDLDALPPRLKEEILNGEYPWHIQSPSKPLN